MHKLHNLENKIEMANHREYGKKEKIIIITIKILQ